MTVSIIPIIVCILGLVMFALAPNVKAQEVGKWMFIAGLFVTLLAGGTHAISIK